jgi:3',5'-cyclic AMP phosphodiesterase CpdA
MTVRLAHLSDIHLTAEEPRWSVRDWFTRRLAGWFNLRWLGRAHRFRRAEEVLTVLAAELRSDRKPDHVIFSGDATALGFPEEMERAAAILGVGDSTVPAALAVPGNHDYYTAGVAASGLFERCFGPWQAGERLDGAAYPFAQRVGDAWLVGVNSSVGNSWPWDATGRVGTAQLDRLQRLLQQLGPGPRLLVTHYPACRANGEPETPAHRLRDAKELLAVAEHGGVAVWLHGHQHRPYCVKDTGLASFPIICAGSATQYGIWGYNEYTLEGALLHVNRRAFDPQTKAFAEAETFDVRLRE